MPNRSLTLRREALADLSSDELRDLAAGQPEMSGNSCPVRNCLPSGDIFCWVPTFVPCITDNCATDTCS